MIISGSFSLGGNIHTFITDNNYGKDANRLWTVDYTKEEISLSTIIKEEDIPYNVVLSNLFEAWIEVAIWEYRDKEIAKNFPISIVGRLLHQVNSTLKYNCKELTGTFYLNSCEWNISKNIERLETINALGECNPNTRKIILTDIDGRNKIGINRIIRTLYHEIIHAVLDIANEKELYSNESLVNVLSVWFREFIHTLKIDKNEEE